MNVRRSALTALLAVIIAAASITDAAPSPWYIGFGAGSGAARGDGTVLFDEGAETIALPLVLNFGAGISLSRRAHL